MKFDPYMLPSSDVVREQKPDRFMVAGQSDDGVIHRTTFEAVVHFLQHHWFEDFLPVKLRIYGYYHNLKVTCDVVDKDFMLTALAYETKLADGYLR